MGSLEEFKEQICLVTFKEIEYKNHPGFDMQVSNPYRYIVDNTTFVDVYFAFDGEKYYIMIFKVKGRTRELITKDDCSTVSYKTVFDAVDKALGE